MLAEETVNRLVMWGPIVGQFSNDTNATCVSSFATILKGKGRRRENLAVESHPEASLELILSSPVRNECALF